MVARVIDILASSMIRVRANDLKNAKIKRNVARGILKGRGVQFDKPNRIFYFLKCQLRMKSVPARWKYGRVDDTLEQGKLWNREAFNGHQPIVLVSLLQVLRDAGIKESRIEGINCNNLVTVLKETPHRSVESPTYIYEQQDTETISGRY